MNKRVDISTKIALSDTFWMEKALALAKQSFDKDEVPVGAVVVDAHGQWLGQGNNQVESKNDASYHAEVVALKEAMKTLNSWRLTDCTLYTTLEPCTMCFGLICLSRVKRIVWGAPDIRHGACGSFINLLKEKHPTHTLEWTGGVLKDESAKLLKEFFRRKR